MIGRSSFGTLLPLCAVLTLMGSGPALAQYQGPQGGAYGTPAGGAYGSQGGWGSNSPTEGNQGGGFAPMPAPSGQRPMQQMPGSGLQGRGGGRLDQLTQWERQDFGVAPSSQLHDGSMEGPTPTSIPGGQVITTKGLIPLIQGNAGVPVVLLDILGGDEGLPHSIPASFAAEPGNYHDRVEQQFAAMLGGLTHGNKQIPLVLYCLGRTCWMSYNASLRAIHLGYKNVLWYRGGEQAWRRAGLPFAPIGGSGQGQESGPQSRGRYPSGRGGYGAPPGYGSQSDGYN